MYCQCTCRVIEIPELPYSLPLLHLAKCSGKVYSIARCQLYPSLTPLSMRILPGLHLVYQASLHGYPVLKGSIIIIIIIIIIDLSFFCKLFANNLVTKQSSSPSSFFPFPLSFLCLSQSLIFAARSTK